MAKKTEPVAPKKAPKVKAPKKATPKESIPKCPEKDERGDKTPAVVAWYRKYKPAEYKVKYHAFEAAKVRGKVK